MRRKEFLLVLMALSVMACKATAPETGPDEAKIRAEAPLWFEAWNKGDAEAVTNLYADEAIVLAPGVPAAVGKAAIRTFIESDISAGKQAGLTNNIGEVTGIGVSGDMAWLSGSFSLTDSAGTTVDSGKYLSVYRRDGQRWMLIRDTWNSDKGAPPAVPAAAPTTPPAT